MIFEKKVFCSLRPGRHDSYGVFTRSSIHPASWIFCDN